MNISEHAMTADTVTALRLINSEVNTLTETLAAEHNDELARVADILTAGNRTFVLGLGRSGLALQMTAMRLMHLGLTVHVVGDATTPAIGPGDIFLAASGSGTTEGIVRAAHNAVNAGAQIVALTAAPTSPLAEMATATITIPAAGKLDRSGSLSAQYAGSLFEQTVVLVGDALFHALWVRSGATADQLWTRHSNLE